jgi:diacylglycerol kinase (ATP)
VRYAIIANPAAGTLHVDQKRVALSEPAELLGAKIYGLETASPEEFTACARRVSEECDVLVAAGGDGTLSSVMNAVADPSRPLAYLPMGSGNSMRYALEYRGDLKRIARRILNGSIHLLDCIDCDGRTRGLFVSLGLEGDVIRLRESFVRKGQKGFPTYFRALAQAFLKTHKTVSGSLQCEQRASGLGDLLSLLVVKHPFYGYGMKVVPKARLDDGRLHVLMLPRSPLKCLLGLVTAFTVGNRVGTYTTCKKLVVVLNRPMTVQIDGSTSWTTDRIALSVLPKALALKA